MQYIDKGFLVWIIPSTFLSHEAVNWVLPLVLPYLLSLGFTLDFRFIIIILYYNCLHPALPLVFYSTSLLILSYYTMHVLFLWAFTLSTCSCMPVLMTQFSMHVYDSDLSIHMFLSLHATWYSHHHSMGSSNSSGSSCSGLRVWSMWISQLLIRVAQW